MVKDKTIETVLIGAVVLGVVLLFLGLVLYIGFATTVDEGERGVLKTHGSITGDVMEPGLHYPVVPLYHSVEKIEIRERAYTMSGDIHEGDVSNEDAIDFMSADQQRVGVDVTVRYQIEEREVQVFHRDWNTHSQYEERVLRPETMDTVQREASSMEATEANSREGRQELARMVSQALNEESPDSVNIISVQIRDIHFDAEYVNMLEDVERAQEEANAARERAQGEADAAIIRAQGEAEALEIVQEQLAESPEAILAYEQIQAYDEGTVYISNGQTPIILSPDQEEGDDWGDD